MDEVITDPIVVESVEAVAQLQAALDEFVAGIAERTAEFEALGATAEQIRSFGTSENTYSKLSYQDLTNKWNAFQALVEGRKAKLAAELTAQEQNEAIRLEFAEKAEVFNKWINEQTTAVSEVTSSEKSLDDKLSDASALVSAIQANADQYATVVAVNQRLEDARITDNRHTELTAEVSLE